MQSFTLLVVERVEVLSKRIVERDKLDHLAFGRIRRFVEHESTLADASFQRLHRLQ